MTDPRKNVFETILSHVVLSVNHWRKSLAKSLIDKLSCKNRQRTRKLHILFVVFVLFKNPGGTQMNKPWGGGKNSFGICELFRW